MLSVVRYTLAIAAIILGYTWVAAPLVSVRGPWLIIPVGLILGLCALHNRKTGDWGFAARAFWPALGWAAVLTLGFGGLLWGAGHRLGEAPHRPAPLLDFLYVMVWGGAQQFVLQTVVLREAQAAAGRAAILVAALVFATFHLPNPFLTIVTFTGGVIWCWIYSKHPNIIPLAISHAASTVIILLSFPSSITGALRTGWRYLQ
jgi:membrane protease YdiL (CAAX protease family)